MKILSLKLTATTYSTLIDDERIDQKQLGEVIKHEKLKLLYKAIHGEKFTEKDLLTYDHFFEVHDYTPPSPDGEGEKS